MTFNKSQIEVLEKLKSGPFTLIYEDCELAGWGCKRIRGSKLYTGAITLDWHYGLVSVKEIRSYPGGREGRFKESIVKEYLVTKID